MLSTVTFTAYGIANLLPGQHNLKLNHYVHFNSLVVLYGCTPCCRFILN